VHSGSLSYIEMVHGCITITCLVLFVYPLICVHTLGIIRKHANTIVRTDYGEIRGLEVQFPDLGLKPVEYYLGIQYGSTLRSELRYMPPTSSLENWIGGTRSAVNLREVCPQRIVHDTELRRVKPVGEALRLKRILEYVRSDMVSEECLNLNLYVPGKRGM